VLIGGAGADYLDGGPGDDRIEGGSGANVIHAGPGNDTILDGEGGSEIHTGPGRNVVISAGGGDTIHVGPGENEITGGPGATTYVFAYGGLCRITDFAAGDVLDLSAWPAPPILDVGAKGVVLQLGTSVVELPGAIDAEVRAAIRQVAW
jgi:Ca2+-binding RTX toxin-like protein